MSCDFLSLLPCSLNTLKKILTDKLNLLEATKTRPSKSSKSVAGKNYTCIIVLYSVSDDIHRSSKFMANFYCKNQISIESWTIFIKTIFPDFLFFLKNFTL